MTQYYAFLESVAISNRAIVTLFGAAVFLVAGGASLAWIQSPRIRSWMQNIYAVVMLALYIFVLVFFRRAM